MPVCKQTNSNFKLWINKPCDLCHYHMFKNTKNEFYVSTIMSMINNNHVCERSRAQLIDKVQYLEPDLFYNEKTDKIEWK